MAERSARLSSARPWPSNWASKVAAWIRPDTLSGGACGRNKGRVAAAGAADADVNMREVSGSEGLAKPDGALFRHPGFTRSRPSFHSAVGLLRVLVLDDRA
jgi:hypothetical protein